MHTVNNQRVHSTTVRFLLHGWKAKDPEPRFYLGKSMETGKASGNLQGTKVVDCVLP